MTLEEFNQRMKGNIFYQELLPIFNCLEIHLGFLYGAEELTPEQFGDLLEQSDVCNLVRVLGGKISDHNRELYDSAHRSLRSHIHQFSQIKTSLKIRKILLAYINLSRLIFEDRKIEEFKNAHHDTGKVIFCVSLPRVEEDNIGTIPETNQIRRYSLDCSNYLVIPEIACSFGSFMTQIKKHAFHIVHLAGHGSEEKLFFSDAGVKYATFINKMGQIGKNFDLIFLNCCDSYSYVHQKRCSYSDATICYDGALAQDRAYDVGTTFYQSLFLNNNGITGAWETTNNSSEISGYHLL